MTRMCHIRYLMLDNVTEITALNSWTPLIIYDDLNN